MSVIKKILLIFFCLTLILNTAANSQEVKKIGKYKDWETIVFVDGSNKVCFAQSSPVLQSPKNNQRDARLFVSFRPNDKISDEISITSGYEYNNQNSITAASGKSKYKFDLAQDNFAWISEKKTEKKSIAYYRIPVSYEIKGNFLGYIKFKRQVSLSQKMLNFDKESIKVLKGDTTNAIVVTGVLTIVGLPDEFF